MEMIFLCFISNHVNNKLHIGRLALLSDMLEIEVYYPIDFLWYFVALNNINGHSQMYKCFQNFNSQIDIRTCT